MQGFNVISMSVIAELERELFEGVRDGRREAIQEAPYLAKEAGLKNPNYKAINEMPIKIKPLPPSTLGATGVLPDGTVSEVSVNRMIPYIFGYIAKKYNKSREWAKKKVYDMAKLTTEHELAHVLSSYVAKGEEFNKKSVDLMETISTYAKHRVARRLGKNKKAEMIENTNPYPVSWKIGKMADKVPYKSEKTGNEGYPALIEDAQSEPFYKPMWRLSKQSAKKAIGYFKGSGVPSYVPA